jgi:hypothetical protein
MLSEILRNFTRQHPLILPLLFPVYFVFLWFIAGASVSFTGGWSTLAKTYRTEIPFTGQKWSMQSGQMNRWMNYNNVLTIGISHEGLYLATMILFRFRHPPLLVPWSDIKVSRSPGWFFKYVTLTMGREADIPLRIRESLAAKLQLSAGGAWPVEQT